jgi:hypothetical protein
MTYVRTHEDASTTLPIPIGASAVYTCPMHPQTRQAGPGNCPICGMTLEPVKTTAGVGENRELADMTRRFWVGLVLTLPVFVLEMGGHIPALACMIWCRRASPPGFNSCCLRPSSYGQDGHSSSEHGPQSFTAA